MTYWITMPGATFSLEGRDGVIVDASAIARWAIGRAAIVVLEYYRSAGANIDWITHEE